MEGASAELTPEGRPGEDGKSVAGPRASMWTDVQTADRKLTGGNLYFKLICLVSVLGDWIGWGQDWRYETNVRATTLCKTPPKTKMTENTVAELAPALWKKGWTLSISEWEQMLAGNCTWVASKRRSQSLRPVFVVWVTEQFVEAFMRCGLSTQGSSGMAEQPGSILSTPSLWIWWTCNLRGWIGKGCCWTGGEWVLSTQEVTGVLGDRETTQRELSKSWRLDPREHLDMREEARSCQRTSRRNMRGWREPAESWLTKDKWREYCTEN